MIDFLDALAHLTHYQDNRFFVLVGLDPLGCFNRVSGITYEMTTFEYKELGRNHSAVKLPFDGPGEPGELVLKTGMVARQMLYDWMNEVKVGGDFYKNVLIVHLTQNWVPLKIYFVTGCWPKRWEGSELQAEGAAQMATEQLTLVFDQISQVPYLGLAAIAGQLAAGLDGAEAEAVDESRKETFVVATGLVAESVDEARRVEIPIPEVRDLEKVEGLGYWYDTWQQRRRKIYGTYDKKGLPLGEWHHKRGWIANPTDPLADRRGTWGSTPLADDYDAAEGASDEALSAAQSGGGSEPAADAPGKAGGGASGGRA